MRETRFEYVATIGQVIHSTLLSTMNKHLAIGSGGYLCMINLDALIAAGLNTFQRSQCGVWLDISTRAGPRGVKYFEESILLLYDTFHFNLTNVILAAELAIYKDKHFQARSETQYFLHYMVGPGTAADITISRLVSYFFTLQINTT